MYRDNSHPYCVVLDGAQTLRNIQEAHDRLNVAFADNSAIEVSCEAITDFDLSLIQLLIAAKRSADSGDKRFTLARPVDGRLRAALERAGFLSAGAHEGSDYAAFWLKGSSVP